MWVAGLEVAFELSLWASHVIEARDGFTGGRDESTQGSELLVWLSG